LPLFENIEVFGLRAGDLAFVVESSAYIVYRTSGAVDKTHLLCGGQDSPVVWWASFTPPLTLCLAGPLATMFFW
tara:strand:- start:588 stop:809 length:222 start_codon:yes stop_codon:yes gene_type:complete